jgi:hypothetical protein
MQSIQYSDHGAHFLGNPIEPSKFATQMYNIGVASADIASNSWRQDLDPCIYLSRLFFFLLRMGTSYRAVQIKDHTRRVISYIYILGSISWLMSCKVILLSPAESSLASRSWSMLWLNNPWRPAAPSKRGARMLLLLLLLLELVCFLRIVMVAWSFFHELGLWCNLPKSSTD